MKAKHVNVEGVPPGPETNSRTGRVVGGFIFSPRPLPELVEDKEAIRAALKESRRQHTKRVRSNLP